MMRDQDVLFIRSHARLIRAVAWCARLGLGFYIQRLTPGFYLLHLATREGAERAHRTLSGAPIYTFA